MAKLMAICSLYSDTFALGGVGSVVPSRSAPVSR